MGRVAIVPSLFAWLTCATVQGAVALSPMTSFGGGDGWLAPGDRSYLTTNNAQRGLAFNPVTGHLLLTNKILDSTTGEELGELNLNGFVTENPGLIGLNMFAAGDDGAIYASNLTITSSAPLRVYRWQNESAAPSLIYNASPFAGTRLGDTLDARGAGNATQLLFGTQAENAYYVANVTGGGSGLTFSRKPFGTNPPQPSDHHLGITFLTGDVVLSTRGGLRNFTDLQPARVSSFSASAATLLASPELTSQGERPMDFAVVGGIPMLASVDTISSIVRVYDMTNPASPILLSSATAITGPSNPNGNGVGQIRFGQIDGGSATLYALNTNNGIQAFNLIVPEPSLTPVLAAVLLLARRTRTSIRPHS